MDLGLTFLEMMMLSMRVDWEGITDFKLPALDPCLESDFTWIPTSKLDAQLFIPPLKGLGLLLSKK